MNTSSYPTGDVTVFHDTIEFLDSRQRDSRKIMIDVAEDFDNGLLFTKHPSLPIESRKQDAKGICRPFPNDYFRQNRYVYFENRSYQERSGIPTMTTTRNGDEEGALALFSPIDVIDIKKGNRTADLEDVLSLLYYLFRDRRDISKNERDVDICSHLEYAYSKVASVQVMPSLRDILDYTNDPGYVFVKKHVTLSRTNTMVLHFELRENGYKGLTLTTFLLLAKIMVQCGADSLKKRRKVENGSSETKYDRSIEVFKEVNRSLKRAIKENDLRFTTVKSTFHRDLGSDRIGRDKMFFPDEMLDIMARKDPSLSDLKYDLYCMKREWKDGKIHFETKRVILSPNVESDGPDPLLAIRRTSAKKMKAQVETNGKKEFEMTFENTQDVRQRGMSHLDFDKIQYQEVATEVMVHVHSKDTGRRTIVTTRIDSDGTFSGERDGYRFRFGMDGVTSGTRKEPKYIEQIVPSLSCGLPQVNDIDMTQDTEISKNLNKTFIVTKTELHMSVKGSSVGSVIVHGHRDEKRSKCSNDPKEDLSAVYKYKLYVNTGPANEAKKDPKYVKASEKGPLVVFNVSPSVVTDKTFKGSKGFILKIFIFDKQNVTVKNSSGIVVPPHNMHKIMVKDPKSGYIPLGQFFQNFISKRGMVTK